MSKGLFGSIYPWLAGTAIAVAPWLCRQAGAQDAPAAEGCGLPDAPEAPAYEPQHEPLDEEDRPPVCFWSSAEFLLWRVKDGPLPIPLVTTAPVAPGVAPEANTGGLGQPGTSVLF